MPKRAIVTGAAGKIGSAITEALAQQGYSVIPITRAQIDLAEEMKSGHSPAHSMASSMYSLIMPPARRKNAAPIQREWRIQFAVNILSYVRMIEYLKPHMVAGARIVNVASYWAGGLDLNDLQFERRVYDNDAAYRQSKQANRMLSAAYAKVLAPRGITVNSCHPGDVNSGLSNDLGFGGRSAVQGAKTPVWLATANEVDDVSGGYFARCAQVVCEFSKDAAGVDALYRKCLEFVGS